MGLKLVFQPAVTALLAYYAFRMPDVWSRVAVLLIALPIGSGPFTIAKLYSFDAGATSGAILASHLGSLATVSLLVAGWDDGARMASTVQMTGCRSSALLVRRSKNANSRSRSPISRSIGQGAG